MALPPGARRAWQFLSHFHSHSKLADTMAVRRVAIPSKAANTDSGLEDAKTCMGSNGANTNIPVLGRTVRGPRAEQPFRWHCPLGWQFKRVRVRRGGGGYGAYQGPCFSIICSGTITTVYTWVRDQIPDPNNPGQNMPDPLDNPPDEVISVESCSAKAWVFFWIVGAFVNCDNGLGFSATYDYTNGLSATPQGTLFKRRPGGQTITLTCTPSASALSDEPDAWVELIYKSGIIIPRVDLVGTTRFYAPSHAIKFLTGQQITGAVVAGISGSFPMPTITSRSWSVDNDPSYEGNPPNIFKSYTHTNMLGQLNAHNSGDLAASTFSFYTADGTPAGRAMQVKCDLVFALPQNSRFEGGLPAFAAKSKVVEAVRPGFKYDEPANGTVQLLPGSYPTALIFGDAGNNPGQKWANVDTQVPTPFSNVGQGCFVQLITANRNIYRNTTAGHYSHFTYQTSGALDTAFPYPYDPLWNLPAKGRFVDSPAQSLNWNPGDGGGADWYLAEAADSFKVWAMYRPPAVSGQATEWIPIASYEWSWEGTAQKQGGAWSLINGTGSHSAVETDEHDLPTWQQFSPSPFTLVGVP